VEYAEIVLRVDPVDDNVRQMRQQYLKILS
jgi:hypothetical protein